MVHRRRSGHFRKPSSCLIKTTVYLTDMKDFKEMNNVYAQFFSDKPPARVTVEVSRLPRNVRLEIDAVKV